MDNVKQITEEIKNNLTQRSSSVKDEVSVMRAIMNDPEYSVDVYGSEGKTGEYKPGEDFRKMISKVISDTTKIPVKEASALVESHEFTKSDAATMIGVSKEFVNTYLQSGRKLPLGGRADSNVELLWKKFEAKTAEIPTKDGRKETFIPEHSGIKVSNPCPSWVTK